MSMLRLLISGNCPASFRPSGCRHDSRCDDVTGPARQVVHFESLGFADIATGRRLEPDAISRIFSMTKPVTAVTVMMLAEQGQLRLDDPISDYIPEFAHTPVMVSRSDGAADYVPLREPLTIYHLLTHTSGMYYWLDDTVEARFKAVDDLNPAYSLAEMVTRLADVSLAHQPGDRWLYCGLSYEVLGRIIEIVAGAPLDQFFDVAIFAPLGMVDTGFIVPPQSRHRLTSLYTVAGDGAPIVASPSPHDRLLLEAHSLFCGSFGLVSTATDYCRFGQVLVNEGALKDVRLLSAATVREIRRNQLPDRLLP